MAIESIYVELMLSRFFIETLGCQMNTHDSEKIAGLLAHRGMIPACSPEEADLFLLNTCSVREKAVQKAYSRLGEIKARKKEGDLILGVVGCVAQQEGEEMVRKAPFVDLVVGTHLYHCLPDLLDEIESSRGQKAAGSQVATQFLSGAAPVEIGPVRRQNDFRAHVTIMEGCNKRCSFCIVPYTRGRERNRPSKLILEEIGRLVDQGFVEVILLGQTVNSYRDPTDRKLKFADLLAQVAQIPGLRRIRFTSPHPREFDDDSIGVIGSLETICDQVHLPVQCGSTRVLRRMRRQYASDWYLELIEKFRRCGRFIRFSTDIIVGFPGETEQDFEHTLALVKQVEYESMFSFKYSPRPHTEAYPWEDDVSDAEKTRRLTLLQQLQRDIQLRLHRERYLHEAFQVLVEGTARDGHQRFGRTSTNKIVNFPGDDPPGRFTQVLIHKVGPNSLLGRKTSPVPISAC